MTKGSTFTGLKIVLCFFVYSEISFFLLDLNLLNFYQS